MSERIKDIVYSFEPISLDEMEGVKLMNRIDTKYVVSKSMVPAILDAARVGYYVQEVEGKRVAMYETVYYDTEGVDMYMRHHDKQLVRQKIRVRQYVDSKLTFLEIKRKNNKGRTKKKRIVVPGFAIDASTIGHGKKGDWSVDDFVAEMSRYVWEELSPRLRTKFYRITLVNKDKTERITMDMDLEWENMVNGEKRCYPELVIIEVKRDGRAVCGEGIAISEILRNLRVHPFKISKYCIGTALTNPSLKQNRFKTKIRNIEKLCQN